jgi:hypothetical protein
MREDEIGLRHNPVLRLSYLTRPTGPNCKKTLKSLSTSPKNRTTVEVRVHMPAPSHHDGPARLCTEPLVPCRRKQLTESTSAGGAFSASPASSLGYLKLLTANKRIARCPFSDPSPSQASSECPDDRVISRSAPRRPLTMGRSLTTWHPNNRAPALPRGATILDSTEKHVVPPLPTRKRDLKPHTSYPPKPK